MIIMTKLKLTEQKVGYVLFSDLLAAQRASIQDSINKIMASAQKRNINGFTRDQLEQEFLTLARKLFLESKPWLAENILNLVEGKFLLELAGGRLSLPLAEGLQ